MRRGRLQPKRNVLSVMLEMSIVSVGAMTARGTLKMRDMKLRDMKMRHHVAGVENARHESAAPECKGGKCET